MMKKEMKKAYLISTVLAVHFVVVGGALLIQGCGTTRGPVDLPTETPMPPPLIKSEKVDVVKPVPSTEPEVTKEVFKPEVKTWEKDEISTYVVRKGDTLSQIANHYDLSISQIMALNTISDPGKIRIGQKLVLPGKIDVNNPAPKMKTSAHIPTGSNSYVVQAGDCLSVIAAKAGVTTKSLREANHLKGDTIYVGRTLVIPGGKKIKTTTSVAPVRNPVSNPVKKIKDKPVVEVKKTVDTPVVMKDFKVPDLEPEQPLSSDTTQTYVVKKNDDILSVASEFNVSIADLLKVNKLSSSILTPGQKLLIPTQD